MTTRRTLIVLAAATVVLSACGSAEDPVTPPVSPAGTDTTVGSATSAAPPSTMTASSSAPDLDGTSWDVVNYQFTAGLTNVLNGTEITMTFAGGTITGSTGCNEYTADYTVSGEYDEFEEGVRDENDGQAITITIASVTERACERSLVMEQESDFLTALEDSGKWLIARDQLILRTAEGFLQVEADPAA